MALALTAIAKNELSGTINIVDETLANISKSKFKNVNISFSDSTFCEMLKDRQNNNLLAEHLTKLKIQNGINFSFAHAPFYLPFYYSDFILQEAHPFVKTFETNRLIEGMATNPLMNVLNMQLTNCLNVCSKVGITKLNFHLGSFMNPDGSHNMEKSVEENIKFLEQHVENAISKGIMITIENGTNLQNPVLPIPKELIKVCDHFNQKYNNQVIGICYDVGHARCGNYNLEQDILDMDSNLVETHLTDNYGKDTHNTFGNGDINWESVGKALNKIGYKGNLTYEINFADTNYETHPIEALNKTYDQLEDFAKSVNSECAYELGL